jgi:hypothetical protein
VIGYGELERTDEGWRIGKHLQPDFGKNDWSGREKNWVFFESGRKLFVIYECDRRQVVLELDEDGDWSAAYRTEGMGWEFGEIRGGTSPVPFDGQWLRFFHSNSKPDPKFPQYHLGALLMEPVAPFRITAVSREPIMSGTGECPPGVWHWKPNVCIPYGCVEEGNRQQATGWEKATGNRQQAAGWMVSLGINDGVSAVARLGVEDLKLT